MLLTGAVRRKVYTSTGLSFYIYCFLPDFTSYLSPRTDNLNRRATELVYLDRKLVKVSEFTQIMQSPSISAAIFVVPFHASEVFLHTKSMPHT